jgi:hypothetical protein
MGIFGLGMKALKGSLRSKVAMANKRLARLEANNLTDVPAYKNYQQMKENGERFTSKGDDYNELQKEMARVESFLNSKTSLVRGANKHLKEIAERVGIRYDKVSELPQKTKRFFELTSKVEQYLKNVEGSYHAIGYQKVWESVSDYIKDNSIDLTQGQFSADDYLEGLIDKTRYDRMYEAEDWENMEWFNVDEDEEEQ